MTEIAVLRRDQGKDYAVLLPASEEVVAGQYINRWHDGFEYKARLAHAGGFEYRAHGYVLEYVKLTMNAYVLFLGKNAGMSGLIPLTRYYLSLTPGMATTVPPTGAGRIVQFLGNSISETTLDFNYEDPVILGAAA